MQASLDSSQACTYGPLKSGYRSPNLDNRSSAVRDSSQTEWIGRHDKEGILDHDSAL